MSRNDPRASTLVCNLQVEGNKIIFNFDLASDYAAATVIKLYLRKKVVPKYLVKQVKHVIESTDLKGSVRPYTRHEEIIMNMVCNNPDTTFGFKDFYEAIFNKTSVKYRSRLTNTLRRLKHWGCIKVKLDKKTNKNLYTVGCCGIAVHPETEDQAAQPKPRVTRVFVRETNYDNIIKAFKQFDKVIAFGMQDNTSLVMACKALHVAFRPMLNEPKKIPPDVQVIEKISCLDCE